MFRKPKPKDAARTIIEMYAAKGIKVPMSLALETVAKVEGYSDWGAMARAVPAAKEKTTKKTAGKPTFPKVSDDQGPFDLYLHTGHYASFERFARACDAAEMFACDPGASDQLPVTIRSYLGDLVAAYIDPDNRFKVVEMSLSYDPAKESKPLEAMLALEYEDQWFSKEREDALKTIKQLVHEAVKDDMGQAVVLGLQEFDCDDSGRVVAANPRMRYLAHVWMNEVTVASDAPEDVLQALQFYLK